VWDGGGGKKNMATEKREVPNSCRQKKMTISQPTEEKK
jgi:hypothetical protein